LFLVQRTAEFGLCGGRPSWVLEMAKAVVYSRRDLVIGRNMRDGTSGVYMISGHEHFELFRKM
jgi:hypothetical protein